MRLLAIVILSIFLTACTLPGDAAAALSAAGTGSWSMGGTCDIDEAGWTIDYDKSEDETTFTFRFQGGSCKVD